MIITITMNPALDKTAEVDKLVPGELNRLKSVRVDAGGKGVNVSKMISALGSESVCSGFIGGGAGQELCALIDNMGIKRDFLEAKGLTRTNLKVVDANSALTELNEPGIEVTDKDLAELYDKILALSVPGDIIAFCGSLPQGADTDTYYSFAKRLRDLGYKIIVDADGESFKRAMEAPPHIVKPNRFELLQYYNLPQDTPDDALPELCEKMLEKGLEWVALSLGKEGAMFFNGQYSAKAKALPVKALSTVGAGDSMVGALAYSLQENLSFEDTVSLAMGASIGAVATLGTNAPSLETVNTLRRQIKIEHI